MYDIFIPKSEALQKHIDSFCVLNEFKGPIQYLAFPQLGTSMALYMNAKLSIENGILKFERIDKPNPQLILLGKYTLPIQLKYQDFTPEISIYFSPTGLNYFFKENAAEIASENAQIINSETWTEIIRQLFEQESNEQKIEVLEKLLLEILIDKDLSLVEKFIFLLNENPEQTITDIAGELGVSSKTINRQFAKSIGCSPMEYKKIVRFRKAIHTKFNDPLKNLTQICFDSNFYDSPHFTREFKKLTKMSPSDFFSQIKTVVDKEIPYKFL